MSRCVLGSRLCLSFTEAPDLLWFCLFGFCVEFKDAPGHVRHQNKFSLCLTNSPAGREVTSGLRREGQNVIFGTASVESRTYTIFSARN